MSYWEKKYQLELIANKIQSTSVYQMICNHFYELTASKITSHFFSVFKWRPSSIFLRGLPSKCNFDSQRGCLWPCCLEGMFLLFLYFNSTTAHKTNTSGKSLKLYHHQVRTPLLRAAGPGPGTQSFPRLAQHDFLMPLNSFTDCPRPPPSRPQSRAVELSRAVPLHLRLH